MSGAPVRLLEDVARGILAAQPDRVDVGQAEDLELLHRRAVALLMRMLVARLAHTSGRMRSVTQDPAFRHGIVTSIRRIDDMLEAVTPAHPPSDHIWWPSTPILNQAFADLSVVTESSRSPCDCIAYTYETVLRYRLAFDPQSRSLIALRDHERRKAHGAFYTPRRVASQVVEAALTAATHRPAGSGLLTVLDPAMGTGVFLLETVRFLARERGDEAQIAEACVYGVDTDSLAVELAILMLWLETGASPGRVGNHLRCGNPLHDTQATQFDAVIGNPPWGVKDTSSGGAPTDSFKVFLRLACRLSVGSIGMIVPRATLLQDTHADVRQTLLEHSDPYSATILPEDTFPDVAAPACVLVFGPRPGPAHVMLSGGAETEGHIPASRWSARGFAVGRNRVLDLLLRLQQCHPSLKDLAHLYTVRDAGINYNRASVSARSLYHGIDPDDSRDHGRYRGRDFDRFTPVRRGGWLRHDAERCLLSGERLSVGWRTCHLPEKIVFRQTADRFVATLDQTRMVMGRSVIAITNEGDVALHPLLACLNSRLLTVLYRALAGEEGRILPQVKVGRVLALPIPGACLAPSASPGWQALHQMATTMLERAGKDHQTDAEIDKTVYELYGLTDDEIGLVR